MEKDEIKKYIDLYGSVKETVGPSGHKFLIREQNGEDDNLLSSNSISKEQNNLNLFIMSIVVWTDLFPEKHFNIKNINQLLMKDKYFILFSSRIFSIGPNMKFSFNWGDDKGGNQDYSEDLSKYLWDFSDLENNPIPKEGEEGYFEYRMKPYHDNAYEKIETILSSGKKLRFKMMDTEGEAKLMKKGGEVNKNDDLLSRGLELHLDGQWTGVQSFKFFSKKDMIELQSKISTLEKPFFGFSEIENPFNNDVQVYPLIIDPAFFFPLEI